MRPALNVQFRVDVSAKRRDHVVVSVLSGREQTLEQPLYLAPLGHAHYYQPRKKTDIRSYLMSPYGLMAGFALFAVVVLPMMKVDPEEMKKLQEEMKGSDSIFSGLLGGAGGGAGAPAAGGAAPAIAAAPASSHSRKRR